MFVSYTTIDKEITSRFLQTVNHLLSSQGNTFIDLIHNDSIDKQKRVFHELENSDLLVLIGTKNIYNSLWVIKELDLAEKTGIPKIILFPADIKLAFATELRVKIFEALNK